MFVPFNILPPHARVWIYQTDRAILPSEKDIINSALTSFTEQWLVHGQPMKASFKVDHNHFIILAADEGYNAASGCSIDSSVRALKQLGEQLGLDFFNRTKVAFKTGDTISLISLQNLKQAHTSGIWQADTYMFSNLVATKEALEKEWIIQAGHTWLKRYLSVGVENIKHS